MNKKIKSVNKFWNENKVMIVTITTEIAVGTLCVATATAAGIGTGGAGFAPAAGCGALAGAAGAAVANMMDDKADHSTMGVLSDTAEGALWGVAGGAAGAAGAPLPKAAGGALKNAASKLRSGGGSCPTSNGFVAGTLVLLADGTAKPIEDIDPGDKVLATDPETGETAAKEASATILGEGDKDLVEITVDPDGDPGTPAGAITATDKHPFWVVNLSKWEDAAALQPGQWLRTSAGTHVQVTAVKSWAAQQSVVHNLTIADLHTYYVLAGATPVLVHNCGPGGPEFGQPCTCSPDQSFARLGTSKENTGRLSTQAQKAEENPKSFGHGLSVRAVDGPVEGASVATKEQIEAAGFSLIFTPTRNLPMHHTLIIPKPVDSTVQRGFNAVFGRR